jgi:polysaccharide pyruvyl transferase WcaK-like protein
MKEIIIMGAPLNTNNNGVSALSASIIQSLLSISSDVKIKFLIGNRDSDSQYLLVEARKICIDVVNYRLSFASNLKEHLLWILLTSLVVRVCPFKGLRYRLVRKSPWLMALSEADHVWDIWGGDSFSDIYGLMTFIVDSISRFITIIMKKKYVLLPQTYGPYHSSIAKCISRHIIKKAHRIYSRDKGSLELIKDLLGRNYRSERMYFCPDVAFILDATKPQAVLIKPKLPDTNNYPLVGININGLVYDAEHNYSNRFGLMLDYVFFINRLVEYFMQETDVHVIFIPHVFGLTGRKDDDFLSSSNVFNTYSVSYTNRIHLVGKQYNQNEIKYLIGLCNFFIGSRMHSCVAALSQGIPTIGVAYSKKFLGVFQSLDLDELVVDARSVKIEEAISHISNRFFDRQSYCEKIKPKIEDAKVLIKDSFYELLNSDSSS